jgi:hypothetical protein
MPARPSRLVERSPPRAALKVSRSTSSCRLMKATHQKIASTTHTAEPPQASRLTQLGDQRCDVDDDSEDDRVEQLRDERAEQPLAPPDESATPGLADAAPRRLIGRRRLPVWRRGEELDKRERAVSAGARSVTGNSASDGALVLRLACWTPSGVSDRTRKVAFAGAAVLVLALALLLAARGSGPPDRHLTGHFHPGDREHARAKRAAASQSGA